MTEFPRHCPGWKYPCSPGYTPSLSIPAYMLLILMLVLVVVPAAALPPAVSGITPATGVNATDVSITNLSGTGFLSGATILLTPVNVHPVHKGSLSDGGSGAPFLDNPYAVFVSGNHAYVASAGSNALEIVDVSNPASPVHRGSIVDGSGGALLNWPVSVVVSGNYAYVTGYYSSALEIVDVTNPANPVHLTSINDGGGFVPCLSLPTSVFVSGGTAYITSAGSTALEIVNVTDPSNPSHSGRLDDGGGSAPFLYDPQSVAVSGNYAYITSAGDNTLEIVNVTDPANPAHSGSLHDGDGGAFLNGSRSVFVSSTHAYIASSGSNALEIVDTGTIIADGVNVVSPSRITCSFNLTGAVPGIYNVVVTNPDGSFGTLSGGFTVIVATPTPTPTPTPMPTATVTTLPTRTPTPIPTLTPSPYTGGESDSDPTPVPTMGRRTVVTVNVGGDSSVQRVNVTGTGISDLIVTGTVVSGPGQGISPAPGLIYEYVDLLPARYKTLEKVDLSFTVSRTWLNEQHVTPQDIRVFQLTNSTWSLLPTTLVKSETLQSYYTALSPGFTRFAIAAEPADSTSGPDPSGGPALRTFGDMIKTSPVPTVSAVVNTPGILQTTAPPSLPATQPSSGFSSVTLLGAGIAGIIILIGMAVFFRKGKSDL